MATYTVHHRQPNATNLSGYPRRWRRRQPHSTIAIHPTNVQPSHSVRKSDKASLAVANCDKLTLTLETLDSARVTECIIKNGDGRICSKYSGTNMYSIESQSQFPSNVHTSECGKVRCESEDIQSKWEKVYLSSIISSYSNLWTFFTISTSNKSAPHRTESVRSVNKSRAVTWIPSLSVCRLLLMLLALLLSTTTTLAGECRKHSSAYHFIDLHVTYIYYYHHFLRSPDTCKPRMFTAAENESLYLKRTLFL